ncbi:MAG: tRNA (adenosine(37)-N6)-threonylcarbamoyltransferase complex transferase subunit TsaD [Geothrix sp.]|uniref:tRNA (adenosine(37)-N6)-threonylcarbamoyltransferase complex transferase subunit TsaD n=1 Tax=Geothrix sp. TaxID=1962974 RepID=UPI001799AF94|nr:tRNA (adenosine(37)-N6)-threonylcarbamoyltransferase complex transferase subunit TsaD [Geothrix sp.]NWJ40132.1 tRNA (adenosine(37)-N6)-threonylcarbamoyltransferase complex transferase subunit TsaD [Geothrix sp.]WIL21859.1 MAG: tRNA (adenosine(37)-N6)-threonylcarbamoyltransferase complex transferase subunit TsaD [Geothrix sp.]
MLILGLESSCDDCSAAVVEETAAGPVLRSLVRESQDAIHGPFGGVVPELAAREHLLQVRSVIAGALAQAGLGLPDLDRIAVTRGPGLVGSLLATFSASKAVAWRHGVPWVGVHHLLGHLNAARFAAPDLAFPALVLLVSGGHTHLYLAKDWTSLHLLQKTRDDAAGEAFDKTARMLNLGYPGGPLVDACAQAAARAGDSFTPPKFRDGRASWSFSGLKTGVKLRVERNPRLAEAGAADPEVQGLCRSLQEAIAAWLLKPIPHLAQEHGAHSLVISGGVACNSRLRAEAATLATRTGLRLAIPEPRLCTDNGAMIAAAGALLAPDPEPWSQNADADLKLGA